MLGVSGLLLLKVPHPHNTSSLPAEQLRKLADEIFPNLVESAMRGSVGIDEVS